MAEIEHLYGPDLVQDLRQELRQDCFILGDKAYPNSYPIMTEVSMRQLNARDARTRLKCKKLNKKIRRNRMLVEHINGKLKCYRVLGGLYRHPRPLVSTIVRICAGMVNRRNRGILA